MQDTESALPCESGEFLVVHLEEEQRAAWECGDCVRVSVYLEYYPILHGNPDAVVDLIYNEFLLRQEYGEEPRWEEYQQQFPHLADRLERQRQWHEIFPTPSLLSPSDLITEGAR